MIMIDNYIVTHSTSQILALSHHSQYWTRKAAATPGGPEDANILCTGRLHAVNSEEYQRAGALGSTDIIQDTMELNKVTKEQEL